MKMQTLDLVDSIRVLQKEINLLKYKNAETVNLLLL